MSKKLTIKAETRARCNVITLPPNWQNTFRSVSLEQFHFLHELSKIDFTVFIRIDNEMIEFIQPKDLSTELLKQVWFAAQKEDGDVDVCVLTKEFPKFEKAIDEVRQKKINKLLETDPYLDRKVLEVFNNLSGASQLVLRGGIDPFIIQKVSGAASYMVDNLISSQEAVGTLSRMISIDPTLYDHSASVAMFATIIGAQQLRKKITQRDAQILAQCGLYHDAGKSCIPNDILNKPGAFTPEEFEVMKKHAEFGHRELTKVIQSGGEINPVVAVVALEHHERFKGHGYPHQKAGRAEEVGAKGIHLFARIVAIADTYSALLMKRIYKPAMEAEKALEIMRRAADKDFDPDIFGPFEEAITKGMRLVDDKKQALKDGANPPKSEKLRQTMFEEPAKPEMKGRIFIIDK